MSGDIRAFLTKKPKIVDLTTAIVVKDVHLEDNDQSILIASDGSLLRRLQTNEKDIAPMVPNDISLSKDALPAQLILAINSSFDPFCKK